MTSELLGGDRFYFINTQLRSSIGSPRTSPGYRCHRFCTVQGTVEDSGFSEVTTDWIQCFIQASSCTQVQQHQGPVRTTRPGSPAKWIHEAGHYDLRGFPLLHATLSWLTLGLRYKCSGVPAACCCWWMKAIRRVQVLTLKDLTAWNVGARTPRTFWNIGDLKI